MADAACTSPIPMDGATTGVTDLNAGIPGIAQDLLDRTSPKI